VNKRVLFNVKLSSHVCLFVYLFVYLFVCLFVLFGWLGWLKENITDVTDYFLTLLMAFLVLRVNQRKSVSSLSPSLST